MKNKMIWFIACSIALFVASCEDNNDPDFVPEVIDNPVTSIVLNVNAQPVDGEGVILPEVGATTSISVSAMPSNAGDIDRVNYTYISGNTDIFVVDQAGNITATGLGETVLNVVTNNNAAVNASCKVTVVGKRVTSITIAESRKVIARTRDLAFMDRLSNPTTAITSLSGTNLTNYLNNFFYSENLADFVTVEPADADIRRVRYTSSNPDAVNVFSDGRITVRDFGVATIRVEAIDGSGIYDECVVRVSDYRMMELDRSAWQIQDSSPWVAEFQPNGTNDRYGGSPQHLIDDDMGSVAALLLPQARGVSDGPATPDGMYFVIDFGSPQKFNYFRWEGGWRNGNNTNNDTKVNSVTNFQGRNSLTDEWTLIAGTATTGGTPPTSGNIMTVSGSYYSTMIPIRNAASGSTTHSTANIDPLDTYEYRYLRVQIHHTRGTGNVRDNNIAILWNDFKLYHRILVEP